MSVPFHTSAASIGQHVVQTCQALWELLKPIEMPLPSEEQWKKIAKRFEDLWDYPFAIGALDGKHVAIANPAKSGSLFYNYKGFPSIVLLALSDADSCFILTDCGQYGRVSDAGTFSASNFSTLLEKEKLNIPKEGFPICENSDTIPYVIVGDEGFPLKKYLMRPFSAKTLDDNKRIYNYRHSRCRRTVECAFGILCKKFELLQRPIRVGPEKAILFTNAALVLHNFVRRRDGFLIDRTSSIQYEKQRMSCGMKSMKTVTGRTCNEGVEIRQQICDFFNSESGSVSWQKSHVFRNVEH